MVDGMMEWDWKMEVRSWKLKSFKQIQTISNYLNTKNLQKF
jgi:hypothetical protein